MSGSEEMIGPRGGLKRSEFIRVITDALNWLGYSELGDQLQTDSGISLHTPTVSQFLRQVTSRAWDNSITTLERSQLCDEKTLRSASFLLQGQKFLDFLKTNNITGALRTLRETMVPLDVNIWAVHELATKLIVGFEDDTVSLDSRFKVVQELQKLLSDEVIVQPKRLEYLLEQNLDNEQSRCKLHKFSDMSLLMSHRCWKHKCPSKTVQVLEEHTDQVLFLEFSNNGKYLASSSKDLSAIIWEKDTEGKFQQKHKLVGHKRPVVQVLWSPDDRQVITCGKNEIIRRWNVDSGECIQSYETDGVRSVSCGWFHDGLGIVSALTDKTICLWNLDGTVKDHVLHYRIQMRTNVAMMNDGVTIISLRKEDQISLFGTESRVQTLIRENDDITSFSLSKDNKYLLINLINKKIHLLNIEKKPYMEEEFIGYNRSRCTTMSWFGGFDNTFIASGSEDSHIYIWNRNLSHKPCLVLRGHSGPVNCVHWNPTDLHMFASASDDGTIRIWGLGNK